MPLKLYVHKHPCESKKQRHDNDLIIWNRIQYHGPDIMTSQDASRLRQMFQDIDQQDDFSGLHLVNLVEDPTRAVWNWVRGIHAALYGSYLPKNTRRRIYSPGPECNVPNNPTYEQAIGSKARSDRAKRTLSLAVTAVSYFDEADFLTCWNGACQFYNFWIPYREESRCYWILSLPGDIGFGLSCGEIPLPWSGWYNMKRVPPRVQRLCPTDVDEMFWRFEQIRSIRRDWIHSEMPIIDVNLCGSVYGTNHK